MNALRSARLVGRPAQPADAAALFAAYAADPACARYMTWRVHQDVSSVQEWLTAMQSRSTPVAGCLLALAEIADPGRLIGTLETRFDGHRIDVGYVLGQAWWGRGLMTEALSAVIAWARGTARFGRVWAVCDVDNPASARVMQKSGMQFEGVLRRWAVHPNIEAAPRDCACYAITW